MTRAFLLASVLTNLTLAVLLGICLGGWSKDIRKNDALNADNGILIQRLEQLTPLNTPVLGVQFKNVPKCLKRRAGGKCRKWIRSGS